MPLVELDQLGRGHELADHRLGLELAGLAAHHVDDALGPVEQEVPDRQHVVQAGGEAELSPGPEGVTGPLDRGLHMLGVVLRCQRPIPMCCSR